jgi:ferredoxin-NADP reductase
VSRPVPPLTSADGSPLRVLVVDDEQNIAELTYWVPDAAERDVYVCGPEPWAASVRRTTDAAGGPPEHFHLETFGW